MYRQKSEIPKDHRTLGLEASNEDKYLFARHEIPEFLVLPSGSEIHNK